MKDGSSSWFISSLVIINYGFLNGIWQTKQGEPVGGKTGWISVVLYDFLGETT